jgi:hypothetical protein
LLGLQQNGKKIYREVAKDAKKTLDSDLWTKAIELP